MKDLLEKLQKKTSNQNLKNVLTKLTEETCTTFNLTNKLRLVHFLSQCMHESGNFKITKENLNYSADRLLVVFPKYFTKETVVNYARHPEKIANRVYGGRMGNGNEASGDGYRYCGRGYIQLTGKDNYTAFNKALGKENILENTELVASKYPLESALWFFNSRNLWTICDKGSDEATVKAVTKKINGGTIGLEDRLKNFNDIYKLL